MRILRLPLLASAILCACGLAAQQRSSTATTTERPPAVPLIAHDPYFSVWSMADRLTDQPTKHWTGAPQPMVGLARIDGKVYRFMGSEPRSLWDLDLPAMEQTSLRVTPTRTIYTFQAEQVSLTVTFFTPAFPRDLDALSRPVTYLSLSASSSAPHTVTLLVAVDPMIAVDSLEAPVTWSRLRAGGLTVLNVGSAEQHPLHRSGDDVRIDWGYFHLAVPDNAGAQTVLSDEALRSFVSTGALPQADDADMPQPVADWPDAGAHWSRPVRAHAAQLAVALPLGKLSAAPVEHHLLLAYTETWEVEYLERKLRPYWQRDGETIPQMLSDAEAQYPELLQRAQSFDRDLTADLTQAGGPGYAQLAILAYRQTLAANGFAADVDDTPMLFPKENFSNGCIATVDVIYPASPFFLFFNPRLLEAQLKPVMEYAALPRWKFPFAPHDLGTYPLADGQVYGGGEKSEEGQMPVEESGNMLIMADAMSRETGNWDFVRQYWPQFTRWAEYLRGKGLDPANQLSTDDFTGRLAHNANLSIKAIEGLAAYAQMAQALGNTEVAKEYAQLAAGMAVQWQKMDADEVGGAVDHYSLAFDKPDTWSQKYNLVWDQILGLHLFPPQVRETEIAFYLRHLNGFGLPLDSRATYTKLDWQLWTATLADPSDFTKLVAPVVRWVNEGPSRTPLPDLYNTVTGKQSSPQARSVVGGVYIKMLADPQLAEKWSQGKE